MKKFSYIAALLATVGSTFAALTPGDSLTPYEIKNVSTGKKYCQVCAYATKPAKVIAFGKLNDEKFWADLKTMQELHSKYGKDLGVFAQVLDSEDTKAINARAKKEGITFPVVVAAEPDWNDAYKVDGVSRTVYYAQKNKIAWTSVGLDGSAAETLKKQVKKDLAS